MPAQVSGCEVFSPKQGICDTCSRDATEMGQGKDVKLDDGEVKEMLSLVTWCNHEHPATMRTCMYIFTKTKTWK